MMDYWLSPGSHSSAEDGRCAMEWVAFISNQPHGDAPTTVCPTLMAAMMWINDSLGDEQRQRLRPYLARCVNTAGDGHRARRDAALQDVRGVLTPVYAAYKRLGVPVATGAGWLDPFAEAFFRPGGVLARLLPLERVTMPSGKELEVKPKPAPSALLSYLDQHPVPPVLLSWPASVAKPEPGYLAEPVTEPGAFVKALQMECAGL